MTVKRTSETSVENGDILELGRGLSEDLKRAALRPLDSFIKRLGRLRAFLPAHRGAFEAFGFAGLGRFRGCGNDVLFGRCEKCDWVTVAPLSCALRFCPVCLQTVVSDLYVQWMLVIGAFRYPAHLVLAPPNIPQGKLRWGVERLQRGLRRLKRSEIWRDAIPRAFVAWGLTWNRRKRSWHLHFHFIVDAEWVPRHALMEAARRAFRLDRLPNLHVKRACGDIRGLWDEVFKGSVGDAAMLMAKPAVVIGEARVAFNRRPRWWFLGDYPAAVAQGDDFPVEYAEFLSAHHHSECALCGNPVSSDDWFVTSGPRRDADVNAHEVDGFRQVSQGEYLERVATEKANRPPARVGRKPSQNPLTPLLPGADSW